jgi:hypothetical protein
MPPNYDSVLNGKFKIDLVYMPFILICLFFMINGLFNSLAVSYGFVDIQITSMMFSPSDIHADLIKYVLSFSAYDPSISQNWSELYQFYYKVDHHRLNGLVNNSGLPFYVILSLVINKLVFLTNPEFVVICYYLFVIMSIFLVSFLVTKNYRSASFLALMVLLSYVVFFILTRGHIFSFISSMLLFLFIFSFFDFNIYKSRIFIQVLLYVILVFARPNAIVFGALFFTYSFKTAFKVLLISAVLFVFEWFFVVKFIKFFIEDYSSLSFFTEFSVYYADTYVYAAAGSQFNNSFYGGLRWLLGFLNVELVKTEMKLLNYFSLILCLSLMLASFILFLFKKIPIFYFAYILSSLYILTSSIFTTYHLLFFYVFLFLFFIHKGFGFRKADIMIIVSAIILLSPKSFYFNNSVSIESFINPTVLLFSVFLVLLDLTYHNVSINKHVFLKN